MYMTSVCHCWFGPVGRKEYSPEERAERFQRLSKSASRSTRYTALSLAATMSWSSIV